MTDTQPLYSSATVGGGLIFTSGQIPGGPDGTVPTSMTEQAGQVFDSLEKALADQGGTLADVLQVTVFLGNIVDDFDDYNAVYRQRLLPHATPARTTVEVSRFRGDKRIELHAIARQPGNAA